MEYAWMCDCISQGNANENTGDSWLGRSCQGQIQRWDCGNVYTYISKKQRNRIGTIPVLKMSLSLQPFWIPPSSLGLWITRNHQNLISKIKELNNWIVFYNNQNVKNITPRFHRFGVRDCWAMGKDKKRFRVKRHIHAQWCQEKAITWTMWPGCKIYYWRLDRLGLWEPVHNKPCGKIFH